MNDDKIHYIVNYSKCIHEKWNNMHSQYINFPFFRCVEYYSLEREMYGAYKLYTVYKKNYSDDSGVVSLHTCDITFYRMFLFIKQIVKAVNFCLNINFEVSKLVI